jgi:hypothetical protein
MGCQKAIAGRILEREADYLLVLNYLLVLKDRVSSSAGIAVISFDLPSTSRWPSTRPCSLAQALTKCSGPCARPG